MADEQNDFRVGDLQYDLLRKILARLLATGGSFSGTVTLDTSDLEIGAVEIKDSTTNDRTKVISTAPVGTEFGIVVRNIPSGTQVVDGSGVVQPVSGTVAVSNFPASQAVTGPLTDTQLRATPVPVSGPLTDTQLRATPVPVSGTIAVSNFPASQAVTNAGTFATQDSQVLTDNGAFVDGTSKLFMSGFIFDETAGTALTENDAAAARIDSKRAVISVIEDATTRGSRATVSAGSLSVAVTNALTVASIGTPVVVEQGSNDISIDKYWYVGVTDGVNVLGTVAHPFAVTAINAGTFAVQDSQVIADNAAFTDGTSKVFTAGFIFDETAGTALTENDAAAARVDSKRAQVLVIEDATTRGQRASVDSTGAIKILPFVRGTLTDKSGSITTAATSQTVAASNATRSYFFFQNLSPSPMWINFTTAAVQTQPSIRIDSGAVYELSGTYITTESVLVIAPTAGAIFTAKEG